jgi:hypothetical protein
VEREAEPVTLNLASRYRKFWWPDGVDVRNRSTRARQPAMDGLQEGCGCHYTQWRWLLLSRFSPIIVASIVVLGCDEDQAGAVGLKNTNAVVTEISGALIPPPLVLG